MQSSRDVYYRQLGFPGAEFRWARRKGPGLPWVLEVRNTQDHSLVEEYEVSDIAKAPIGAYLRLAETKFVEVLDKRMIDERAKRERQYDDSERRKLEAEANNRKESGDHLEGRAVGELEREAEGGNREEEDTSGDDQVQHDSVPVPVAKKRGRPRKILTES